MVEGVLILDYLPHTKSLARPCGGLFFFHGLALTAIGTCCHHMAPRTGVS